MTGVVYWLDMAGVIVFALSGVISPPSTEGGTPGPDTPRPKARVRLIRPGRDSSEKR